MKKSLAVGGFFGAALIGVIAMGVGTARATDDKTHKPKDQVCSTWKLRGVTGNYPDVEFGGKPAGASYDANHAFLVKPTTGTMPGVEFATFELGYEADGPVDITANYSLSDGATVDSGAIRMFYYTGANADTINDGPTAKDDADGDGKFKIEGVTKVGTLGFAYDASNSSAGKVTITDVKIGDTKVRFKEAPCEVKATPSATPSAQPTTKVPTKKPTTAPVAGGDVPQLPKTGVSGPQVAGIGAGILVIGAVIVVALRRRRTRFAA